MSCVPLCAGSPAPGAPPFFVGVLAFPRHVVIIPRMKTDYGILRDRAAELIVASAALLDGIGVGFSTRWMSLDDLELLMVRVDESYRRLDHEWGRLVEQAIQDERRRNA